MNSTTAKASRRISSQDARRTATKTTTTNETPRVRQPVTTITPVSTPEQQKQQQQRTLSSRRAALAALTASARAKQVTKSATATKSTTPVESTLKARRATLAISNQVQPNLRLESTSAKTRRPRSLSTKTEPSKQDDKVRIDRELLAALLDDRVPKKKIKDDDEEEQPVDIFSSTQKKKPIQEDDWKKELLEIKTRLQKLEVKDAAAGSSNSSNSSTTTTHITPSVFDNTVMPSSPLTQTTTTATTTTGTSATSAHSTKGGTVHQKRLQDALAMFEHSQSHPSVVKAMSAVVAETVAINQKLWSSIPQDLNTNARTLISLQKSSDNQLKELTEALYLLGGESERPLDTVLLPRLQHQEKQLRRQSNNTEYYYRYPRSSSSYFDYHHRPSPVTAEFHQQRPSATTEIRPIKVAGILDSSYHHQYSGRSKYYDYARYNDYITSPYA